jgi:hypothetical protein
MVLLIIASIVLVSAGGCGGGGSSDPMADTASAAELRSFSEYDFSFQCPKAFLIWEDGLLDDEPSTDSGLVQAAPEDGKLPLIAVSWIRTWEYGLEGGLEAGFEGVENWGTIQTVSKGQIVETTKTGHRMLYQSGHHMLYQYYTATTETQGQVACGIVGAFYCPDTQRAITVVTMGDCPAGASTEAALAEFESLLARFVCH